MHEQLAVEVQYGIVTYVGRSGHNRLSKIESILVDWDVPKSFARSKTCLIVSVAFVAVSLNAGYGWRDYVVSFLTVALVPITLSQITLVLIRSWLPKYFFVYVLGNGFFTAWLVGYISGYLAMQLLVQSGAYTMAELQVTIIPFFPLMFFPEAMFNGWIITLMVVFFPAWVYSLK